MYLTREDITRIEQHNQHSFYIVSPDGWIQLKNRNGRCIFHDGTKCTIYHIRPQGCRLYPLVYNLDDKKPIYDAICPHPECFPVTLKTQHQLQTLVDILFKEKTLRQKHHRSIDQRKHL